MQTVVIIQARMGSSRLPGKVLKPLAGKPMLSWVISRAEKARCVDKVIVATTTDSSDDPIESWCREKDVFCWRGSAYDVLDRYYQAAAAVKADLIVRVTADCPLIDPDVLDDLFRFYKDQQADFAANRLPPPWHRTFPIGLDAEIVSFSWLERAWKEASELFEREHVMPWFYDKEGRCKVCILDNDPDCGDHRWTVDTPEDYQMMDLLFKTIPDPLSVSWTEVLEIVKQHPEFEKMNAGSMAKQVDVVDTRAEGKA